MDVGRIGEGLPAAVGNAYVGTAKTTSRKPQCFHDVAVVVHPSASLLADGWVMALWLPRNYGCGWAAR